MRGELWCIWWGKSFAFVYIFVNRKKRKYSKEGRCVCRRCAVRRGQTWPDEGGDAGVAPRGAVGRGAEPRAGGAPHGWHWGRNGGTTLLPQPPELGLDRASPQPGLPSLAWQPSSAVTAVPGSISPCPLWRSFWLLLPGASEG